LQQETTGRNSKLFLPFLEGEPLLTEQRIRMKWIKTVTCAVILLSFFFSPRLSYAQTESELNFYVTPILPESQLEGGALGYFDLNLGAGERDELALEIENGSDQAIEIEISAHTAFTNVNGVVEYGRDAESPDPTLPASIDELVEVPETISLDPLEKRIISLPIAMPEEEFKGVLAGGIRINEVISKEEQTQSAEEGLGIRNAFSYVIGVVVSNNRSAMDPGLELLDVFADQVNYRNVFRNGEYVLNLTARSGEEEWSWEQTFSVEAEDARRLNELDVNVDTSLNWWMIATAGLISLFLLLVIILIVHKKKKAKEGGNS